MKRTEWLQDFANALGVQVPSENEVDKILKLAGIAAHASERTSAPLACWIAAQSGRSTDEVIEIANQVTDNLT